MKVGNFPKIISNIPGEKVSVAFTYGHLFSATVDRRLSTLTQQKASRVLYFVYRATTFRTPVAIRKSQLTVPRTLSWHQQRHRAASFTLLLPDAFEFCLGTFKAVLGAKRRRCCFSNTIADIISVAIQLPIAASTTAERTVDIAGREQVAESCKNDSERDGGCPLTRLEIDNGD